MFEAARLNVWQTTTDSSALDHWNHLPAGSALCLKLQSRNNFYCRFEFKRCTGW